MLAILATSRFGGPLLLAVSIGALLTQATILRGNVVHTIALTGFLTWLAWRPRSTRIAAAGSAG